MRIFLVVASICLIAGCVSSPSARRDGGYPNDHALIEEFSTSDEGYRADATEDALPSESVDFFSTRNCYLANGRCVSRTVGIRCQELTGGLVREDTHCLKTVLMGCMEGVRSVSPAAICMSRTEGNGSTRLYVVFNRYDYAELAQAARYSVAEGRCGEALGWSMCPIQE